MYNILYCLCFKGEVEQIAMMKSKAENDHSVGMLEYLEDVIGTARYKVSFYHRLYIHYYVLPREYV